MESDPLLPLLAPVTSLRGVGDKIEALLARATGGSRVLDLLFHMPDTYVDRRHRPKIADAEPGDCVTLDVEVVGREEPGAPGRPVRVKVSDGTGEVYLSLFGRYVGRSLHRGKRLVVSGTLAQFGPRLFLDKPEYAPAESPESLPAYQPVWPLTADLTNAKLRAAMREALSRLPELPEWHDPTLLRREGWPSFADALRAVQAPAGPPGDGPRARLAYDEFLAHQVALAWTRTRERSTR